MKLIREDVEICITLFYKGFKYIRIQKYCPQTNSNSVEWMGNDETSGFFSDDGLKKMENDITVVTNIENSDYVKELEEEYQKIIK